MGIVNGYSVEAKKDYTSASYGHGFTLKKNGDSYQVCFFITSFPTQNCQLSSIGSLNNVLGMASARNDVQAIIKEAYRQIPRTPQLILVDVKVVYIQQVEQCFTVKNKMPYTSTNGSSMCLFLLQMDE